MSKSDNESGNGTPEKTQTSSRKSNDPQGLDSETSLLESAARLTGGLATGAIKEMIKRSEASLRWGSNLLLDSPLLNTLSPDRLEAMKQAGMLMHDLRETGGLTLEDLSKSLDMADTSLLRAVENGTATLSFDLVLRLAALLARNDPLPFIIRFVRTYNPQMERLMEGLGAGSMSRQFERERRFVNILRKRDDARSLNDEQFEKLLKFSDSAFNLAMDFVEEQVAKPKPAPAPRKKKAVAKKKKKKAAPRKKTS